MVVQSLDVIKESFIEFGGEVSQMHSTFDN